MKRIILSASALILLTPIAQSIRAQFNASCATRCDTITKNCLEPCRLEAVAAQQTCEDAGGSTATCQAVYDNAYKDCIARTRDSITACQTSQGCGQCVDYLTGLSYYCACGNPYGGSGSSCQDVICPSGTEPNDSCVCVCPTSPIVIDVVGDGFRLTDIKNGVRFDLRNDGVPLQTAWTELGSDDAWLALDRNGDGLINDGSELFGNFTPQPETAHKNGFLALAEFDKRENGGNGDGQITSADSVFTHLRLWRDRNHNGVSELSELLTLTGAGVESISLDYKESRKVDRYANMFRYRAKVNGERYAWDVFLTHE